MESLPDAPTLLAQARERTGIATDDSAAQTPLTRLVNSLNAEGQLHSAGRAAMCERLVRILSNRLRMHRDFAVHPEINTEPLHRPIFICGMARTGSTKTQKLLAATDDFNWLPYWQVLNPSLLSGDRRESAAERIRDTDQFAHWFDAASPETRAGHAFLTHEPEEESFILEHSLRTPTYMGWAPIPSYLQWLFTQDLTAQFTHLRATLQYLQWQGLARPDRPWVLKSPLYSGLEPLLLQVFPDARLVMTHRHPAITMPSGLRLLECFYKPFTTARPDPQAFVAGQAGAIGAHLQVRAALPAGSFLDLDFRDIMGDVPGTLRRIYEFAGQPLKTPALERAATWNKANPQHHFGKHDYSLAQYDLTTAGIETQFTGYIQFLKERFGS